MATKRAYAFLKIKSANAETRTIAGIASTPEPDRMGDVVEPLGIQFKNPVPLLLYHDTTQPVGQVRFFPPTKDGLEFEATLPTIDEPGKVKDRIDEAWQSIKAGLLAGVSIGFRSIEEALIAGTFSFRYIKSEILELSLVAIPAHPGATIESIKALDMAATGRSSIPGVTGLPVVRATKGARSTMTIPEQLAQFTNTRAAADARMTAIMSTASESGATLDATQAEEYDTLAREIDAIDAHLVRLRAQEQRNKTAMIQITPSTGTSSQAAAAARGGDSPVITVRSQLPKGTAFIRLCQAIINGRGWGQDAINYAERWKDSTPEVGLVLRAAVAPGNTTDAAWAGPLVVLQPLATEFLELLRPATLIGKIANLMNVPFNVQVPAQTGGGTYQWVGQGAPKPVSKLQFAPVTLGITKVAGIIVITAELARSSTPSAEAVIRRDMIAGIAQYLDQQFTDPTVAPVANVSPGSITNGITPITSAGTSPNNARTDILALAAAMVAANIAPSRCALIMSETNALALGASLNPLGQSLFPGLGVMGGTAEGFPVYTSETAANHVIMAAPEAILFADDGGVTIDVSREASVQMDSAPDNPALATTILASLWQNNLVGLRAERYINWKRGRTGCVAFTNQTYAAV